MAVVATNWPMRASSPFFIADRVRDIEWKGRIVTQHEEGQRNCSNNSKRTNQEQVDQGRLVFPWTSHISSCLTLSLKPANQPAPRYRPVVRPFLCRKAQTHRKDTRVCRLRHPIPTALTLASGWRKREGAGFLEASHIASPHKGWPTEDHRDGARRKRSTTGLSLLVEVPYCAFDAL